MDDYLTDGGPWTDDDEEREDWEEDTQEERICPECGYHANAEEQFCPRCGEMLW